MRPKTVFNFVEAISQIGFMRRTHGIRSVTCRDISVLRMSGNYVIGFDGQIKFSALTGKWKLVPLAGAKVKP